MIRNGHKRRNERIRSNAQLNKGAKRKMSLVMFIHTLLDGQHFFEPKHKGCCKPHYKDVHGCKRQTNDPHRHKILIGIGIIAIAADGAILVDSNLSCKEQQNATIYGRRQQAGGNGNTHEGTRAFVQKAECNANTGEERNGNTSQKRLPRTTGQHFVGRPSIGHFGPADAQREDTPEEDANNERYKFHPGRLFDQIDIPDDQSVAHANHRSHDGR
mmetsp:Transcript_32576/g.96008  ORF Transcript_32576/g.96008 Transcript_32576/m.96008 type:complete len:215 (-) Transcript_32576:605-1249(-)